MRLLVHIIEARNLLAKDANGFSDPFVVVQLGGQKNRTKVINMNLNPTWDEKFSFEVRDVRDALRIYVYDKDRIGKEFLGKVKFPLSELLNTEGLSYGTQWYKLNPENDKSKIKECEILLKLEHRNWKERVLATNKRRRKWLVNPVEILY